MTDPIITTAARAAAERLADDYGAGLPADVEAALHAGGSQQRPERYLDATSIADLIISIATLAWTIYTDLKRDTGNPAPDVVARTVRVELHTGGEDELVVRDKITEVVVTEITKAANEQG